MKFEQIYGATPIDPNEASGLIPKHIQTQAELNAFEHLNISLAIPWAFSNHKGMDAPFLKRLLPEKLLNVKPRVPTICPAP